MASIYYGVAFPLRVFCYLLFLCIYTLAPNRTANAQDCAVDQVNSFYAQCSQYGAYVAGLESSCVKLSGNHFPCGFYPLPAAVQKTSGGMACIVTWIESPSGGEHTPTSSVTSTVYSLQCNVPPSIPDPDKNMGSCPPENTGCTNPINIGGGNKFQTELDYVGEGTYPFRLMRTYNSGSPTSAGYGPGWRGSYSLAISDGGIAGGIRSATVIRGDGKRFFFTQASSNSPWVASADIIGTLVRLADNAGNTLGWNYLNSEDEFEEYDATGKLTSITNRIGLPQILAYSCSTVSSSCPVVTPPSIAPVDDLLLSVSDSYGRRLQFAYDGSAHVSQMTDPSGKNYSYAYEYFNNTNLIANLVSVSYPTNVNRQYLYGESGKVSANPANGVDYAHALTGIVDENGSRYATWQYDSQGRAISSEHGNGIDKITLSYGAMSDGATTTVATDALGTVRSYGFQTILGVTKNVSNTGPISSSITYDVNGNVASRINPNGNQTCYSYDLSRNLEVSRIEGLPSAADCMAAFNVLPAPTTANPVRIINTQWHGYWRLPAKVTEPLKTTTYIYNGDVYNGNTVSCAPVNAVVPAITGGQRPIGVLCQKIEQPTDDATGEAGANAQPNGTPRIDSYTYSQLGQLLIADGPRSDVADVTVYTYYGASDPDLGKRGNVATVVDALGHTTSITSYDANSRPLVVSDPNGLAINLAYDDRGRLVSRNAGGEITVYAYDGVGNLTGVQFPGGASYSYSYDAAHRLIGIADSQGNAIHYTLDLAGNRVAEQVLDASSNILQTHSRVFDALSRLYQDIGAMNQITTYAYDANGNLTNATDPLNRSTVNTYDALDRLIGSTDPASGQTRYSYDGLDQLTQVTDPRDLITQYVRSGLGTLDQVHSPDTGTTTNTYDAAGNMLTRTDAKGQIASYTYDALNRITGISYTGAPSQTITYTYDQGTNGIGHLTSIQDSTGTTTYVYDQHGRLTSKTAQNYGATYTTAYSYDAQGRLNAVTYPSGRVISYGFDTQGRVSQVTSSRNGQTKVLASNAVYRPFGGIQSFTYGDGSIQPAQTYTRQIDQDGLIASYTLNGQTYSIGYDAAAQISSISNPAGTASYGYDPTSRLTSFTQGSSSQSFSYDLNGNRISQAVGSAGTAYTYSAMSNQLNSIQPSSGTSRSVVHDANGAITEDGYNQYSYDQRGRLLQTVTAQGAVNYEVNALGLRVRKQVPYAGVDTVYHYDDLGHLIGEGPTGTTSFTKEYIYLGDQPIAVMQ